MPALVWNRYGKASIRLVRVSRERDLHELIDLTIDVQLEGAFASVYTHGDNATCLATDTMKNTVYAFARDPIVHVETFALKLADHFIAQPSVTLARVSAVEHRWDRLRSAAGEPHPHAFVRPGSEQWSAIVTRDRSGARVVSGVTGLVVLKTTDSGFVGFPRDRFTTLPETTDRILATSITAAWTHAATAVDFSSRGRIRAALLEKFAAHDSKSVQHTLFAMGQAALDACGEITEITLSLPNRHHVLVNLEPFGLDNPGEVFVVTEEPFGMIEATVRR